MKCDKMGGIICAVYTDETAPMLNLHYLIIVHMRNIYKCMYLLDLVSIGAKILVNL